MSTLFNIQVHKGQPGSVLVKYVDPTGAQNQLASPPQIIIPGGEGTFVVHGSGSVLIERVQTPELAKPAAVIPPPSEVPVMDSAPEAEPSKEE